MKFLLIALLFIVSTQAWAVTAAQKARVNFATDPVTTTTWVPLVSSLPKAIKAMSIMNTGNNPMYVGVAAASSSAGQEVAQLVIPPGTGTGIPQNADRNAIVYPLSVAQNQRISIISLNSTASYGELEANFFFY